MYLKHLKDNELLAKKTEGERKNIDHIKQESECNQKADLEVNSTDIKECHHP